MAFAFPKQNNAQKATQVYSLGKELGSGAFSRVVLATRITDKKEFAIKIVDKDETDAKDMYKELEVMSKLSHPNLVNFEEIFDERDGFYVVLELITGGELFDRIIELQKYSEKDASSVLKDALLGLQHMHERGFAHRDIKPENLLLASKDSNAHVKVADFGFSTSTHNDHDLWETLGTPPYMAPEIVILRNEDVEESGYGRPVDVWALGICLYILLSGCHPYQQSDEEKMLCNIEQGIWPGWKRAETWKFNFHRVLTFEISEDAKDLVKKMMDPKAASRLTVVQCLQHPWMLGQASGADLTEIKDSIKAYQAKKKMRAAILGVMATNKMRRGFSSLATINAQAAVQNVNNNNTNATNPQSAPLSAPVESKPTVKPANTIPDKPHDLLLKVTQGRNLIAKDANGKSDPYLNIWCGKYKFKTKTIKKWDETFVIPYNACFAKTIEVDCMDYDLIGKDDFMGCFSLKVNSFHCGTPESRWVTLVPKPGAKKAKVSGDIQIEVTWRLSESS